MTNRVLRSQRKALVEKEYERLKTCLAGNFGPGYFNSPEANEAEQNGLSICDAMLGYVLDSNPDEASEVRARELMNRVSRALVPSQVESKCHNLHGACALMLDELRIPVVMVWGSVCATDQDGHSFSLNHWNASQSEDHRPGHSWLLTPYWRVADISIVHQSLVPGNYEELRKTLPSVITVASSEASEPDINWWRLENGSALSTHRYAESTMYHEIIGWSQHVGETTTVRYLPAALEIPREAEMGEVNIRIGGVSPREFFDRYAGDLIP